MTYPVEYERVLLVEGQDDKHLVWQLCDQDPAFTASRQGPAMQVTLHNRGTTFHILEKGNDRELLRSIPLEVTRRNRQALGVIIDADADHDTRWNQIVSRFSGENIILPPSPRATGTIIPPHNIDHPRVGVWLLPDNGSEGELEDFALKMIPHSDDIWPLSQNYIDGIPVTSRKFQADKTDKAELYAWLAARKEPGRMGAAVGSGDLDPTIPICRDFLNWLTDLFN